MPFNFNDLFKNLAPQIGIDLGTSNTPILVRGKGIVSREPSFVAKDTATGKVIAVGEAAKLMHGRTPENITVIRPLRDGVIANFEIAYEMLKHMLSKALPNGSFFKPSVIIGIPSDCTPVEKRAVEEAATHAGGRRVVLVAQPLLAAIGAMLPVKQPVGSMVVDIGGGTTEIAIISLGGIVSSQSLRVAGDKLDEAVLNHIKKTYNLLIGERTAEAIKIQLGSAMPQKNERLLEIRGRDVFSGLPRTQKISNTDIQEAVMEPLQSILEAIRNTLEQAPPELVSDVMSQGVVLAGGGALLDGLDLLIQQSLGVPCHRPADPINAIVQGAGLLFEDESYVKQISAHRHLHWERTPEVA